MSHFTRSKRSSEEVLDPIWINRSSATELKKDILQRIDAFLQHEINKNSFPFEYESWTKGEMRKMTSSQICDLACTVFKLQSVRKTTGSQLSKRIQVLSPFHISMETPKDIQQEAKEDEITDIPSPSTEQTLPAANQQSESTDSTQTTPSVLPGDARVYNRIDKLDKQISSIQDEISKLDDFEQKVILKINDTIETKLEHLIKIQMDKFSDAISEIINQKFAQFQSNFEAKIDQKIQEQIDKKSQIQIQQAVNEYCNDKGKDHIKQTLSQHSNTIIQKATNDMKRSINVLQAEMNVDMTNHPTIFQFM